MLQSSMLHIAACTIMLVIGATKCAHCRKAFLAAPVTGVPQLQACTESQPEQATLPARSPHMHGHTGQQPNLASGLMQPVRSLKRMHALPLPPTLSKTLAQQAHTVLAGQSGGLEALNLPNQGVCALVTRAAGHGGGAGSLAAGE